jgi:hypothetical protein
MLLRRLQFIPWVSAIEYGHVAERHLAIGTETVPSVRWYHYDVSCFGDHVGSVDCIDAPSFDQDEHLAAAVAMLGRAATRRMGVHAEDQIKTVIFAAEKPPAWIVRGRLHVRGFDKRRQRFDHLEDLHPTWLGVDAHIV